MRQIAAATLLLIACVQVFAQRRRFFYRRELDDRPLVVARTAVRPDNMSK